MSNVTVTDNTEASRLEFVEGDLVAELVYGNRDGRLVLEHTGVPDELEGRGIGSSLVRAAVDKARSEGLAIVPSCSFARSWLESHPEGHEGVEIVST